MTSIEIYKAGLGLNLKRFFEKYESSMKELIDNLDSDGFLLKSFSEKQIDRLQILINNSNMALKLKKDFYSILDPNNEDMTKKKLSLLREVFNADDYRIGQHMHVILTNTYIAFLERLKIFFLVFIDWDKLGKPHKKIFGLGHAVNFLSSKYDSNKYLNYFSIDLRNALTHYTFSWKHGDGGKLYLYSEIFDENPKEMSLVEFMRELNEVNVLTEGFYMMLRDKYGLPVINLEKMEK